MIFTISPTLLELRVEFSVFFECCHLPSMWQVTPSVRIPRFSFEINRASLEMSLGTL